MTYVHCTLDTYRVMLIALPQQKWLRERALVLRYTHFAYLVKFILLPFIGAN
jgi:hypothetical protein